MLFKDVLVDESVKERLINMVKENRVSHAQLFLSSAGSHAFALAVAFAQYLSCQNRGEHDSCGVCPSCVKFEKLSHPDFHLIFPNCTTTKVTKDPDSRKFLPEFRDYVFSNNYHININSWLKELGGENKQATINIRDCGQIVEQNSIRSYEGGYKIYLLWMVERLYHDAAPKLLKTLEEPENKTLFILLSENADNILSTIKSRTQLVKIPPLSDAVIAQQLQKDFEIEPQKAQDIAAISEGNYVKAIELYNDSEELQVMLSRFSVLLSSMMAFDGKHPLTEINYAEVQKVIEALTKESREAQKNFVLFISRLFRNMLLLSTNNGSLVKATAEELKLMNEYQSRINIINATKLAAECNTAIFHLSRNGNSGLVLTDMYLKMSAILAS